MKRYVTLPANVHIFKLMAVAVTVQAVLGYVLGWELAAVVVCAAFVGYASGHLSGYKRGSREEGRIYLQAQADMLAELEKEAAAELAADHPQRVELAAARRAIVEELER